MTDINFIRTARAASVDKRSKWDLIEAIAQDATANNVPIVGVESRTAAKEALDGVGNEYQSGTVKELCAVAKFDHESTAEQRKVWRNYGWSIISKVARAGLKQEAALALLAGERKTQADVVAALGSGVNPTSDPAVSLDERWHNWVSALNNLLVDGTRLAEATEAEGVVAGSYAAVGLLEFNRVFRKSKAMDAEFEMLLSTEAAG